jgi:hypothetical protein
VVTRSADARKKAFRRRAKQEYEAGIRARKSELLSIPAFAQTFRPADNEAEYNVWAKDISDSVHGGSQERLHPLLSYIWLPYQIPDGTWTRSWIPMSVPESTPSWKLTLMYCLGANTKDITRRMITVGVEESKYASAEANQHCSSDNSRHRDEHSDTIARGTH